MARVHASKVKDYETSLQSQIRDRQEAFEPAYTQELQHYKQYGTTTGQICSIYCLIEKNNK